MASRITRTGPETARTEPDHLLSVDRQRPTLPAAPAEDLPGHREGHAQRPQHGDDRLHAVRAYNASPRPKVRMAHRLMAVS